MSGLVLLAFGGLTLVAGRSCPSSPRTGSDPALCRASFRCMVIGLGLLQLWLAWENPGPSTGAWSLGRAIPVAVGAILFALAIRGFEFGRFISPNSG